MTDSTPTEPRAYYLPLRPGVYRPTVHVQGAWQEHEQHMAPIAGLITQALATHEPRDDMQIGRICFDILGMIPLEDTTVEVQTIRPGRTIELLEATLSIGGRTIVRARCWRLAVAELEQYAGTDLPAMPGPDEAESIDPTAEWPGGYISSLTVAAVPGGTPGRRQVWLSTDYALIAGVQAEPIATYTLLLDTANGIATRVRPTTLLFPNVDLTVHYFRTPQPPAVGLDTTVSFGPSGLGLTSSVLNDIAGPVGRLEQCLTVRPFPEA